MYDRVAEELRSGEFNLKSVRREYVCKMRDRRHSGFQPKLALAI
jgi:hypothetical protein